MFNAKHPFRSHWFRSSYEAVFKSEDATAAGLPSISHGSVVVGPGDVKLVSADDDVALLVSLVLHTRC